MLIKFVPSGEIADTDKSVPQSFVVGPYAYPILSTPAGYTPVQGTLASGKTFAPIGQGGTWIIFKDVLTDREITRFAMEDASAVTTGIATIATALGAGQAFLSLEFDGTETP
jgi:hypothetical protein